LVRGSRDGRKHPADEVPDGSRQVRKRLESASMGGILAQSDVRKIATWNGRRAPRSMQRSGTRPNALSNVLSAFLAAFLFTAVACSTTATTTGGAANTATQGVVPEACYVTKTSEVEGRVPDGGFAQQPTPTKIRCAGDAECGAGARCDTALSPPSCVLLYCLPDAAPCAHGEECLEGLQCFEGRCNPCNVCGNQCSVDLNADPKNCGECGRVVVGGQTCVDGVPTCPERSPTLCDGRCVDTTTDTANCGACGQPAPSGGTCGKGKATCPTGETACSGKCVDLSSDENNCGACSKKCGAPTYCGGARDGHCGATLMGTETDNCEAICAGAGLRCLDAQVFWKSFSYPGDKGQVLACNQAPPPPPTSWHFNQLDCTCEAKN